MRYARFQSKSLLFLDWTMEMHCYIISPSLSDKPPTASVELYCTCSTSFVPAALVSCTFKITVQYTVSYIQSTEWNSTSVSERSESYSLLRVPKKPYSNVPRDILLNISSQAMERVASKDIFCKVLKTNLFKLAYL